MKELFLSRLAPFRHRSFRDFFLVQTLSLSGTWAADLARAWLVIDLMGSASALGMMLVASAVPGLFLILHGGVLVDRINVRKLMIATKLGLATVSLGLGVLIEFSQVEFWQLLAFGFFEGLVTAFDSPAYLALTVRLVPRQDFQQALALNSTNFHLARMLGPLIAGVLMALHGPSAVFFFDAATYLVLVWLLSGIQLEAVQRKIQDFSQSQWQSLVEGLKYIRQTPQLLYKVLQLILTISLIFPVALVVFRAYIQDHFQLNAEEFGYIFTFPALGSMTGALSFAVIKPKRPIRALLLGIPGAGCMMLLVPLMPTALTAAITMAFSGFFMYLTFAALTVSIQLEVEEEFRGRISSIFGLCFVSIGPLMSLPIGALADHWGFRPAISGLTLVFLLSSALLALLHRSGRLAHKAGLDSPR